MTLFEKLSSLNIESISDLDYIRDEMLVTESSEVLDKTLLSLTEDGREVIIGVNGIRVIRDDDLIVVEIYALHRWLFYKIFSATDRFLEEL